MTLLTPARAGLSARSGPILGFLACVLLCVAAIAINKLALPLLSPLVMAMAFGILVRNTVGVPSAWRPGITIALKKLLRLAIIVLGLQLSVGQVLSVGGAGLAIVLVALVSTIGVTIWLGRLLGVEKRLTLLIATGTSICGASAILAANTVVEGKDEDVAYSLATVTLFGSASLILFPIVGHMLGLSPGQFGLWTGASIHEVAQVVGAAFQGGPEAGAVGTIAKLTRVLCLAPVVLAMGMAVRARRSAQEIAEAGARPGAIPVPWFVAGFLAMVALNSLVELPGFVHAAAAWTTPALLTLSLAAMGLETDLAKLKAKGLRPLILGALATLFITGIAYGGIILLDPVIQLG